MTTIVVCCVIAAAVVAVAGLAALLWPTDRTYPFGDAP